jgi:hypothetical protein
MIQYFRTFFIADCCLSCANNRYVDDSMKVVCKYGGRFHPRLICSLFQKRTTAQFTRATMNHLTKANEEYERTKAIE